MYSGAFIGHKDPEHVPEDAEASCRSQTDYRSELKMIHFDLISNNTHTVFSSLIFFKMPERIKARQESQLYFGPERKIGGYLLTHQNIGEEEINTQPAWINPFDFHRTLSLSNVQVFSQA